MVRLFFILVCANFCFADVSKFDLKKFEQIVANVYVKRSGFLVTPDEVKKLEQDGACSTYGEILPESLSSLFSLLPTGWSNNAYFIDLGSGVGKTVLQAGFYFKKAIGVELSETRHTHAIEGHKEFLQEYTDAPCLNIEFRQENMMSTDLSCDQNPAFVFMCSTCFNNLDNQFMQKMADKIESAENIQVVVSLTQLDFKDQTFQYLGVKKIPMTWLNSVSAYVYVRKTMQEDSIHQMKKKLDCPSV